MASGDGSNNRHAGSRTFELASAPLSPSTFVPCRSSAYKTVLPTLRVDLSPQFAVPQANHLGNSLINTPRSLVILDVSI